MTDFQSRDLIEATKGEASIRDRLSDGPIDLMLEQSGWSLQSLFDMDWEVQLLERPVIRPTVPGWYLVEHPEASSNGPIAIKLWGTIAQRWSNGWDHELLTDDWLRGVTKFTGLYPVADDDVVYLTTGASLTVEFPEHAKPDARALLVHRSADS